MRTTITLDDDDGDAAAVAVAARMRTPFESPTFDLGLPNVDLMKVLRLAGDLEDEALAEQMRRGA